MMRSIVSALIFILSITPVFSQTVAFPGAEGFGAYATGGRGGSVYHVTNLNDSGPGSFRDAVSQPDRTVVFNLSGVIRINSRIDVASNITIAGQTAPEPGITVYGDGISFSNEKNVIVRYMRFHGSVNMPRGKCVLTADNADNMIFDHCSVEWGRWDNVHIKTSKNITMQYCIIGESINPQMFGALLEHPTNLTIHHCLWIDNQSRNPKGKAGIQFINNVIYNWKVNGFVGGHSEADHFQDLIGNYFIAGPDSRGKYLGMFTATDHVYHRGNLVDLNKDGILNGIEVTDDDIRATNATLEKAPHQPSTVAVSENTAAEAYDIVLAKAGASLYRDDLDNRMIEHLKSLGTKGHIILSEENVGGQKPLASVKASKDKDLDGMPDAWEKAHKLNSRKAADANADPDGNGYTNLEEYLNSFGVK